jgi:hypothetical protein
MVVPYLLHQALIAVADPLFAALLRLAGVPARLPHSNEDCVWY